jgi:putative transcriptional regulator
MSPSDNGGEPDGQRHAIEIRLDKLLADRDMTLTELASRTGIAIVNLSILKNGHARAIRFTTLSKICDALGCQPGDLITHAALNIPDGHDEQQTEPSARPSLMA